MLLLDLREAPTFKLSLTLLSVTALVAVGHLANSLILSTCTVAAIALSFALDSLPSTVSKFCLSYGFLTLIDPILILIVDLVNGNFDCLSKSECRYDYTSPSCLCTTGDAFKLWSRMARIETSGVTGAFYTFVIYFFTTLIAGGVLYHYVLLAHQNGRMLDNVKRIHAPDSEFFVPEDNELSLSNLANILGRAKRWRGPGGTVRKIDINIFTVKDNEDSNFEQKMTHIAIHTVEVDGERTLFRHFLRLANGSVVEVDDKIGENFSGQLALEKLLGSGREQGLVVEEHLKVKEVKELEKVEEESAKLSDGEAGMKAY